MPVGKSAESWRGHQTGHHNAMSWRRIPTHFKAVQEWGTPHKCHVEKLSKITKCRNHNRVSYKQFSPIFRWQCRIFVKDTLRLWRGRGVEVETPCSCNDDGWPHFAVLHPSLYFSDVSMILLEFSEITTRTLWISSSASWDKQAGAINNRIATTGIWETHLVYMCFCFDSMLVWCWPIVVDDGPASNQHWFEVAIAHAILYR